METIRVFSSGDAIHYSQSGLPKDQLLKAAKQKRTTNIVFLSHSSRDDNLIPGLIAFFKAYNADIYTDDFDSSLPNPPSTATAAKLKSEIQTLPRLVVLATKNTYTSRWIPWELGLADGFRGIPPNAILPSTLEGEEPPWLKTEYFNLYPKIVNIDGAWQVSDPRGNPPWDLKDWLHKQIK
jgi:antiphage defense system Thoeris ThsB-like protein